MDFTLEFDGFCSICNIVSKAMVFSHDFWPGQRVHHSLIEENLKRGIEKKTKKRNLDHLRRDYTNRRFDCQNSEGV